LEVLNETSEDKVLRLRISAPSPAREQHRPWGGCHGGWRRRHCPSFAQSEGQQPDLNNIINSARPFIESFMQNLSQGQQEQTQSTARHFGVVCDGCEQDNFTGDRYKCNNCPDFDYCGQCFNTDVMKKSHGENHTFTKISTPQRQAPPTCPGFNFMNHPLAQQFAAQFQGAQQGGQQAQQPQQFDINQLISQYQPFVQQFASQFQGAQQGGQPFDINQLISQYQPVIQEFVQNLTGENATEQPQQPTQSQQPSAPQATEEEIVINDEPVLAPQANVMQYQTEIEQLAGMGFTDVDKNKELLQRYNGNIQRVITVLLQ